MKIVVLYYSILSIILLDPSFISSFTQDL